MRQGIRQGCEQSLRMLSTFYGILLFVAFPLYYQEQYFNMGEAKYAFVKYTASYVFPIIGLLAMGYLFSLGKVGLRSTIAKCSVTDWCVIGYGVVVILSYIHTPYKEVALWGYEGWYMGLMSQLLFVVLYLVSSRFFYWNRVMGYFILLVAMLTHIFAILHRFLIDPLGMYQGVLEEYYILFLSTIGQATWYSSYLCIVLPLGMVWYCRSSSMVERFGLGIYIIFGASSLVTQNSDSAFASLCMVLVCLVYVYLGQKHRLLRVLEVMILIGVSWVTMGILQQIYDQYAITLDSLSTYASQSVATKVIVLLLCVSYGSMRTRISSRKAVVWNVSYMRRMMVFGMLAIGIGFIGLMVIVTTNRVPESQSFLRDVPYLNFNDDWGNARGFSWKICSQVWSEYPITYGLLGCGPDAFAAYAYEYYYEEISQVWGSITLTNAHNEWFTTLLFTGILGFISYVGIFISQLVKGMLAFEQHPILLAGAMCIVSYMVHNFFCYQQIVCTPLLFYIMGVMEWMRRRYYMDNETVTYIPPREAFAS